MVDFIIRVMVETAFWGSVLYVVNVRNKRKCSEMCDRAWADGYHEGLYQNVIKHTSDDHQAKGDSDE